MTHSFFSNIHTTDTLQLDRERGVYGIHLDPTFDLCFTLVANELYVYVLCCWCDNVGIIGFTGRVQYN